jgi:hypothetical protein
MEHPSGRRRCRICQRGWNTQLNFGAGIEFAPHIEPASDQLRSLAHARKAPVPRLSILIQKFRINPFAVIAKTQAKLVFVIADFRFNPPCLSMAERVAQGFAANPVNFVA